MCSAHGGRQQMPVPYSWCLIVTVKWLGKLLGTLPRGSNREWTWPPREQPLLLRPFWEWGGHYAERWDARAESTQQTCSRTLECQRWSECKCYSGGVILPLEVVRGRPQPAPSAGSALNASANPEKITDSQKGHKAVNIMNSTRLPLGSISHYPIRSWPQPKSTH